MRESTVAPTPAPAASDQLVMQWAPVTDGDGRTHLEARWVPAGLAAPIAHHAA